MNDLELALLLLGDARLTIQKQGMLIKQLQAQIAELQKQVSDDVEA